jgi:hypothetical protein
MDEEVNDETGNDDHGIETVKPGRQVSMTAISVLV